MATLRIVALRAKPRVAFRQLKRLEARARELLPRGDWKLASQARVPDQPALVFGSPGSNGTIFVHELADGGKGDLRPVCEIPRLRLSSLNDVALLPNRRIAWINTDGLYLASLEPACEVIDKLGGVRAIALAPILEGHALALATHYGGEDIPGSTMQDMDIPETSPVRSSASVVRIEGDVLLPAGEVRKDEVYGLYVHEGRVLFGGGFELLGAADACAAVAPATLAARSEEQAQLARARRAHPLAAAGITARPSARPRQPPADPAVTAATQALVGPKDWISPPRAGHALALLVQPDGRYAVAVADDERSTLTRVEPALVGARCAYELSYDGKCLGLSLDNAVYAIDTATGRALQIVSSARECLAGAAIGELVASLESTVTGMALQMHRRDGTPVLRPQEIVADQLVVVGGGEVLVAFTPNYPGAPSYFFAVAGDRVQLLGYARSIVAAWDDGEATWIKDRMDNTLELVGLRAVARQRLDGKPLAISLALGAT